MTPYVCSKAVTSDVLTPVQDQKLITSYRTETEAKLRQVEELSDPDHPRVFHVTQCSACQGGLDLPTLCSCTAALSTP